MAQGAGRLLLLVAALLAAASPAAAAIFAVDLGSENLKLSIVKPGRIPISIVINEMSKRKTPALVAFIEGDRLIGEEAASMAGRYPERVYGRVVDWLGKPADDPSLAAILKDSYRPYTLVPATNRSSPAALGVQTDSGAVYSAEEVVASVLEYAKQLAQVAADGMPVTDCVLTVPASFTPHQRQALLDAAKLAGLNVMGLIHNHAAAALQYGIERDFANRTEHVVFYDLGAASLQAALVRYSAYTNAKGVSTSQFEIRDVVWRENLGGEQLELALLEHFADEFNALLGNGQDVRTAPRAMAKLRKQVGRTKQILSANSEAPISVEELWQDRDFRSTIKREKFEELAGEFWTRAAEPVTQLLQRNGLVSADIAAVELLGGTSRVPKLKQALSDVLGGRALDMHLDADEAVVLGAGLFAANLSTIFRLRQFGMADKVPYSVDIQMEGEADPKVLVPAMKRVPTKRALHLTNHTSDSMAFTLTLDNAPGAMPDCHRSFQLGAFNISGIHSVIAKYNESGKVSIHTRVDQSGMFHVDRADASVEVEELIKLEPPAASNNSANGTAAGNSTDAGAAGNATTNGGAVSANSTGTGADGNTTGATESEAVYKTVRRVVKVALNISGGFDVPPMSRSELEASKKVMRTLRGRDLTKRDTAKSRNDLEAYIISTRDKVESGEDVAVVTTEEQRQSFLSQLTDVEDWLYGDGESVDAAEYKLQLQKLKKVGDAIFIRVQEAAARPMAVKLAIDFVELTRKAVNSWPDMKPWLSAEDIKGLVTKVDDFHSWLTGKQAEQAKLADHQDPAYKAEEVTSWLGRVQKAFNQLNNKKKPRPPPPPPDPTVDTNTTATNGTDGTAGNGTDSDGGQDAGAEEGQQQQQQGGEDSKQGADDADADKGAVDDEEDIGPHDELR